MSRLSKRQEKILEGIVQEWSNKKIARKLGMTEATVRNELYIIFRKCVDLERVIRQMAACQSPHEMRSSRGFRQ